MEGDLDPALFGKNLVQLKRYCELVVVLEDGKN